MTTDPPMRPEKLRRLAFGCVSAGAVVLIDQLSKAWALTSLSTNVRVPVLGDWFGLQLAFNPGATLSFGAEVTWLVTLLGAAIVAVLVVALTRARTSGRAIGLGIVLGGALGNMTDRLFASPGFGRGYVTDFLAYGELFIGNIADVALGVGVVILFIDAFARSRRSTSRQAPSPRPTNLTPEEQ